MAKADPTSRDPLDAIRRVESWAHGNQTFHTRGDAERHVAGEELRRALQRLGLPHVVQIDRLPDSVIEGKSWQRCEVFDDHSEGLRRWLVDHVHELLPFLQLVASTHPKPQMVPVEKPE